MKKIIFILLLSSIAFAQVVVSPNMSLPVPVPGVTTGPEWADDINSSLALIDSHNHSSGQGVQVNPDGININADFPMNNNNITTIKTARFFSQVSTITSASPNIGALYVVGNELYYNDYSGGHQVQITTNGSVNAGAGSITGLPSGTASASFAGSTFTFRSATNTAANIDGGSHIFREVAASANGITVSSPNSLAAPYSLTWFTALPASTQMVTVDTSGNMGYRTSDQVGTGMTATGANAIGASMTSTGANAVAASRTRATGTTVGAGGVAISTSSGTFSNMGGTNIDVTNLTVTITTSGRPIMVGLMADGDATLGNQAVVKMASTSSNPAGANGKLSFLNGSTVIAQQQLNSVPNPTPVSQEIGVPSSSFHAIDVQVAGTYTYKVQITMQAASTTGTVLYTKLYAYEL